MAVDFDFEIILRTMKKAAGALRDAEVPFLLGGGLAVWARGGAKTEHDVDFLVKPEDAERAQQALVRVGLEAENPPEGWLLKAWDGNVLVTKLLALSEQNLDYASVLEMGRAVREQLDWDEVRRRCEGWPYAKAFLYLVEELGVAPAASPR